MQVQLHTHTRTDDVTGTAVITESKTTSSVLVLEVHLEHILDVDLCDVVDDVSSCSSQGTTTAITQQQATVSVLC